MNQPVTEQPATNPLMTKVRMPGETFTLPSRGLFYNNGELDSSAGGNMEVSVMPMSVIDEITLKTPDKLFSGMAVDEVFARCIPQVLKPRDLLAKDVDFLMLCLRKVSYGTEVEFTHRHEGCSKAEKQEDGSMVSKRNSYIIDVNQFIQGSKHIDPEVAGAMFTAELDGGFKVEMNPIRFGNFITMMQAQDQDTDKTPQEQMDVLIHSLLGVITNVNGTTESAFILEWLPTLKPSDLKLLNAKLTDGVKWGPDFIYKVPCKDCGETLEVVAPQNPLAFFS